MNAKDTNRTAAGAPVGYLRRAAAAKYCGISPRFLGDLQRRHVLPYIRIGKRCVLFRREDLDRALDRYRVAAIGEF